MTARLLQVLVVVDVQGATNVGELEALLPDRRDERRIFSLREHGQAPRVVRNGLEAQPIDWIGLGHAVERVARDVRAAIEGRTVELYIGGQGPLPVFAHLGHALSKFTGAQWFLARRQPGAALERFPLTNASDGPEPLVARRFPTERSPASGQVAVYLDVMMRSDEDKFRSAIERAGDRLADVVELVPEEELVVTRDNAASLIAEVDHQLSRVLGLYPHASLGLFVGGPALLAFAAGRAVNPAVVASTTLYDHHAGVYEPVYILPFRDRSEPVLPADDTSVAARAEVEAELRSAIEALQADVTEEDLALLLPASERQAFLQRLITLRHADSDQAEFSLSLAHGTFSFGEGLLEALRHEDPELRPRFAKLLLLHELFHDHQGIRSTNYFDLGRAGVVLEIIDFVADVFALRVAIRAALRRLPGPPPPRDVLRVEVGRWLDAVLQGIQAFDRLQHGDRIGDLADRRLRRYLTWHLQRVRAETVATAADVEALLDPSLTVELAPVAARIDQRFDRQVIGATPSTELFASAGGRLIRHAKRPGFDPGALVEAVRAYNTAAIHAAMRYVVDQNRSILVPWRP